MIIVLRQSVILVFLFLSFQLFAQKLKPIKITSADYPPFCASNLKDEGAITEVVKLAFEKSGYDMKLSFYAWVRGENIIREAQERYSGMFSPWFTKKRAKVFHFSKGFIPNEIGFYKRKKFPLS